MSPEIRVEGWLLADIPDVTGWHLTNEGTLLHINLDGIDADGNRQLAIINSIETGGPRVVGLTQEGRGSSTSLKKGGDGKEPVVEVILHDRPIRVTYSPRILGTESLVVTDWGVYLGYHQGERRTIKNPRWMRGHGGR